jgi:hypothetical protein
MPVPVIKSGGPIAAATAAGFGVSYAIRQEGGGGAEGQKQAKTGQELSAGADTAAKEGSIATESSIASKRGVGEAGLFAKANSGKAPYSELNAAIGEEHGWQAATRSQTPIRGPKPASVRGPDFITYDPESKSIFVWDSKYRKPGGHYPSTIPPKTMQRWAPEVRKAVEAMPDGPEKMKAMNALNRGAVEPRIYRWPPQ